MPLFSPNAVARLSSGARARRFTPAAGGLLLAALAAAPALADVTTPILSGLAWRSGATGGAFPCLAQLLWPGARRGQHLHTSDPELRRHGLVHRRRLLARTGTQGAAGRGQPAAAVPRHPGPVRPVRGWILRRLLPPDRRQP